MGKRNIHIPVVKENDNFSKEHLMAAVREAAVVRKANNHGDAGVASSFRNGRRPSLGIQSSQSTHRKIIAPSNRHFQLMREVSGLGMDDPITRMRLGAGKSTRRIRRPLGGPIHEQQQEEDGLINNSNLPTTNDDNDDDGVSIASDPTATFDNGIDMAQFEKSLACIDYISKSTQEELSASIAHGLDMHTSTTMNDSQSILERIHSKAASSKSSPVPAAAAADVAPSPTVTIDFEKSLASLNVEDVMDQLNRNEALTTENTGRAALKTTFDSQQQHNSTTETRKSGGGKLPPRAPQHLRNSTTSATTATTVNSDVSYNSPTKPQQQQGLNSKIVEAALQFNSSSSSVVPHETPLRSVTCHSPRRSKSGCSGMSPRRSARSRVPPRRTKSSDAQICEAYQAPRALGSSQADNDNNRAATATALQNVEKIYGTKSRNMPNIANLFPEELDLTPGRHLKQKVVVPSTPSSTASVVDGSSGGGGMDHDKFVMSSRNHIQTPVFYQL